MLLFVMRPHAGHPDRALNGKDLVNQTVLKLGQQWGVSVQEQRFERIGRPAAAAL